MVTDWQKVALFVGAFTFTVATTFAGWCLFIHVVDSRIERALLAALQENDNG